MSNVVTHRVVKCWVYEDQIINSSDHLPMGLWLSVNTANFSPKAKHDRQAHVVGWGKISKAEIEDKYTKPLEAEVQDLLRRYSLPKDRNEIESKSILGKFLGELTDLMKGVASSNIPQQKSKRHLKPYWTR